MKHLHAAGLSAHLEAGASMPILQVPGDPTAACGGMVLAGPAHYWWWAHGQGAAPPSNPCDGEPLGPVTDPAASVAAIARFVCGDALPPASAPAQVLDTFDITGEPAEVPKARHRVAAAVQGHARHDDIVLLASELITNAVVHSDSALPGGKVTIAVSRSSASLVRVEVTDAVSRQRHPQVRKNGIDAETGKGLDMVKQLSMAWGTSSNNAECSVWFEMANS
jgi:hypothetical protein